MRERIQASDKRALVVCFLLALVVRTGVVTVQSNKLEADTDGYRQLAENLRTHGTLGFQQVDGVRPTAFRPPLYPVLLSVFVRNGELVLSRVAMLHVALGGLTAAGVWAAARMTGLQRGAWVSAVVVAIDPLLLNSTPAVMTETLAALLAIAAFLALHYASDRNSIRTWFAAGAILGLAALCRPVFLASAGLMFLAILVRSFGARSPNRAEQSGIARVQPAVAFLLGIALLFAPWIARNASLLDRVVIATSHGGYTMLLGNNPSFYQHLRKPASTRGLWRADALDRELIALQEKNEWTETEYDRWAGKQATQFIQADATGFLLAATHRISRLWGFTPTQLSADESKARRWTRYGVGAWYAVVLGLAIWGLIRFRRESTRQAKRWLVLFALSFTIMHAVYWCDLRMRTPLMPLIAVAAGWGCESFLRTRRDPAGAESTKERSQAS